MGKANSFVKWQGGMAFEADVNGHKIILDADQSVGGEDKGARPKALMLTALAGCTGMDVISILKKMRVELTDFKVNVIGDLTEEHPKHFSEMKVVYEFWGKDLPIDKIEKAINLSQERYCGVSYVYQKIMPVEYEIILHK